MRGLVSKVSDLTGSNYGYLIYTTVCLHMARLLNCSFIQILVSFCYKKISSYPKNSATTTYINNCPTRCNTKQSVYYSASSLYMFRVSTTPIMSTQNCNYSLQYWSYFLCSRGQASLATLEEGSCTKNMTSTRGCSYSFVYS